MGNKFGLMKLLGRIMANVRHYKFILGHLFEFIELRYYICANVLPCDNINLYYLKWDTSVTESDEYNLIDYYVRENSLDIVINMRHLISRYSEFSSIGKSWYEVGKWAVGVIDMTIARFKFQPA